MTLRMPPPPAHRCLEVDVLRERFAAGDDQALEECQDRFGPLLLANARRIVGSNDAEDVVQTAMIEAWRKRHRYDPRRPLEAWLLTILRRRAIDLLRRQKTVVVTSTPPRSCRERTGVKRPNGSPSPVDVRRALNELPDPQRETLVLSYFGGMSQNEVATRIDTPLGTIKSRTTGGLQRLASLIGARGVD